MVFVIFIQIVIEHSVSKHCRPRSAVAFLDVHCLYMSHKKDTRLILVCDVCICPIKKTLLG